MAYYPYCVDAIAGTCEVKPLLLATVALFTMALSEPDPIEGGDPRYRTVEYRPGAVVRLVAARGQTLMVEMPQGMEIFSVLVSDDDVMKNITHDETPTRSPGVEGQSAERRSNDGCSQTANMQVCLRRDRFIFFKPLTDLDPQPVPVIMLRPVPGKEPVESTFLFQIETAEAKPVRVAGGMQAATGHYYGVRVTLPPVAQRPTVAGPTRPRVYRPAPTVTEQPPAVINRAYSVEGDRSLVGEVGR